MNIELLKTKILKKSDYQIVQNYDKINLYDNVILYSIGNGKFRIVDLNILLSYPVIYDTYQEDTLSENISVIVCPLSLRSIILKGILKINSYDNTLIILEDNDNNIIPINMKHKIDSEYIIHPNKRFDVKIMKLKNALMYSSDATFIVPNDEIVIDYIIKKDYYENFKDLDNNVMTSKYHPKTLCYLIYFKDENIKKTGIILGKDIKKREPSGYNLDKSGLTEYLNKRHEKIMEKNIFIMPILLYVAIKEYEDLYMIKIKEY